MKRTLFAVGLVLVGVVAYAQDVLPFTSGGFQEIEVSQPCGANGLKGAVSMTVYEHNAWLVYTCNDDRVVLRRYAHPSDKIDRPMPVYTVADPNAGPTSPDACAAYPGFVMGKRGGCVPPNHPDAR